MGDTKYVGLNMPPYDHRADEWKMYRIRLEQFFEAAEIKDVLKKKTTLLSLCCTETLKLLCGLCEPNMPQEKTYDEILAILESHFTPSIFIYNERKIFYETKKTDDETILEYVLRLRKLASSCKFETRLEDMILDKFITGMEGRIYERLIEDDTWTLEKAIEISKRYELRKDMQSINNIKKPVNRPKQRHGETKSNSKPNQTKPSTNNYKPKLEPCIHCGFKNHLAAKCRYKNVTCNGCGKKGHMKSVCTKSHHDKTIQSVALYEASNDSSLVSDDEFSNLKIFNVKPCIKSKFDEPIVIDLQILNVNVKFQLDTGSPVTAIPGKLFDKYFKNFNIKIKNDNSFPQGYGGDLLVVRGYFEPKISYDKKCKVLKVLIIEHADTPILGRDFLKIFNKKVKIFSISNELSNLERLIKKFDEIFDSNIGKLKNVKVKLEVTDNVLPKFVKARPVPYAFKKDIERQLTELSEQGIITKISNTEWGTPLVPILKDNGKVRICADYKVTLNPFLKDNNYPIPRIQDILTTLSDGKVFSKVDLASAYNQLELDEESKKYTVWSTHIGNFTMNRLPFGVKPATGIFQCEMDKILKDIPGVAGFLDDIIVSGPDLKSHNERLQIVFDRIRTAGLRLNKSKCLFAKEQLNFLGHTISKDGIYNLNRNETITDLPIPKTVTEIRSFCGLVNFYGKYIPNLATKMNPMYKLLKLGKQSVIKWNQELDETFNLIKKELMSKKVLSYYNPELPLILTCDASNVGIGAVLAHKFPDGSEKPIEFASRTLSSAEQKYAAVEKEALAIIFATKKFYQYLIGRHFTLNTDHKPLLAIFGEHRGLPQMSANRLQRWAFQLSAFNYTIKHVKSAENCADLFSRLPQVDSRKANENDVTYLNFVTNNSDLPIIYDDILSETQKDKTLMVIIDAVKSGNKNNINKIEYKSYFNRFFELTVENELLLWGHRIVVPQNLRTNLLDQIHKSHLGIVKTKSIIRSYIWWPNIDVDIEQLIKGCDTCLAVSTNPPKAPNISWSTPNHPWERLHIDYAGPVAGVMLFIQIDAFSKWIEVSVTHNASTEFSISSLRALFSRFGIPRMLVSDNGSQFTSDEFKHFLKVNNIKHVLTAPGYAATNGAAENAVKTVKQAIKRALYDGHRDINKILNAYLFDYRTTVHCATGISPADNLFKYKPRTRLDFLKSPTKLKSKELIKKFSQLKESKYRKLNVNDLVVIRMYKNPNAPHWEDAIIFKVLGPRSYICKILSTGRLIKRHLNQIKLKMKNNINLNQKNDKKNYVNIRNKTFDKFSQANTMNSSNYRTLHIPNKVVTEDQNVNESIYEDCNNDHTILNENMNSSLVN